MNPSLAPGLAAPPVGITGQVFDADGNALGGAFIVGRHRVGTL